MTRKLLVPLITAATLVAGACGSDDGDGASTEPVSGDEITITSKDVEFDVTEVVASVGDTITFTHVIDDGAIAHNIAFDGPGVDVRTDIESDTTQTVEVTFPEAGTYRFICVVHPNMKGTVTVS